MAKIKGTSLQPYPRRQPDGYLADDSLFPLPESSITAEQLNAAITRAFERALKNKSGEEKNFHSHPKNLSHFVCNICVNEVILSLAHSFLATAMLMKSLS